MHFIVRLPPFALLPDGLVDGRYLAKLRIWDTTNAINGAPDPVLRLGRQDANVEGSPRADAYGAK